MFEIDTSGYPLNYTVLKDIGGGCGNELLATLKNMKTQWLPAQIASRTYTSRFILPVIFGLDQMPKLKKRLVSQSAKVLNPLEVVAKGVKSNFSIPRH